MRVLEGRGAAMAYLLSRGEGDRIIPSSRPKPSEARRSGGTFFRRFAANRGKEVPPLRFASVGTTSRPRDRLEMLGQLFGGAVERRMAAFQGDHLARQGLH